VSLREGHAHAVAPPLESLGRYRIAAVLGSGAMGTVYRAEDALLQRQVAIKVLSAPGDSSPARTRVLAEARSASALSHPGLCTIFEVDDSADEPFIVMEYVEGQTLSTLIPPGEGLPAETVLAYGVQLADAVAHAHDRGVLHRDLKCSNVIVTPDQRLKVLDFGLAIEVPSKSVDEDTSTLSDPSCASSQSTPGTLLYMSPELLRGAGADKCTDIWALGVILYEMATGERPFQGSTRYELSAAILTAPIRSVLSRLPDGLRAVIARCLSRDPSARYHSAAELRAALEALQDERRWRSIWPVWARAAAVGAGMGVLLLAVIAIPFGARRLLHRPAPPETVRLAVIPLVPDGTPFETEAIAEGIAETVLNDVARLQVPGLQVISLSTTLQYKRATGNVVDRAREELNVAFVATVKVTRQENDLIVSASVDDARDSSHKWGDRFTRSISRNIFAIENEIAATVGNNISQWVTQRSLSPAEHQLLARRTTRSEEAWQRYAEGRTYWYMPTSTAETYLKSLERYREALKYDPNFALAYIGIADTYLSMAWEGWIPPKEGRRQCRDAMNSAMAIDPSLGELHYTKVSLMWWTEDWVTMEKEYKASIREVPSSISNRRFYSLALAMQRRFEDAIAILRDAVERDPKGVGTQMALGTTYYWAHRLNEAIAQLKVACMVDPSQAAPHEALADVYEAKGLEESALRERQQALRLVGQPDAAEILWRDFLRSGYETATRQLYARQLDEMLVHKLMGTYVSPVGFALLDIKLGKVDEAFEWLNRAAEEEAPWRFLMEVDPAFDPIRNDPRFAALVPHVRSSNGSTLQHERITVVSVVPTADQTRNVIETEPNLISSPSFSAVADSMRRPLSHVPFLLPASSTNACAPLTTMRACRREIPRASSQMSAAGSRPMTFAP
jgi:eukaryotic-like serine/threonine-protein kinase